MRRSLPILAAVGLLMLAASCAKKPVAQTPPPPVRQSLFLLLPEENHPTTAVVVANSAGSQPIEQPYHAVRVTDANTAPAVAVPFPEEEVRRRFGALLATLPAPAETFALNFDAAQEALAAESRPQLALILAAIERRKSTDVTVIGHTDTTDTPENNYQLGLRRAEAVAAEVRRVAPAGAAIFVVSHGESDPLVKTEDNVNEPRNRRVEVIVR